MKYDKGKPDISLIPPEFIIGISKVLMLGLEKYGRNNWREDADKTDLSRTYSSIQRHLLAFWAGEDNDPESGLSHLYHAATQIMMLEMHYKEHGDKIDNRWKQKDE